MKNERELLSKAVLALLDAYGYLYAIAEGYDALGKGEEAQSMHDRIGKLHQFIQGIEVLRVDTFLRESEDTNGEEG